MSVYKLTDSTAAFAVATKLLVQAQIKSATFNGSGVLTIKMRSGEEITIATTVVEVRNDGTNSHTA